MSGARRDPGLGPGSAVLAFDVGGTDIKSAYVTEDGAVEGIRRSPTPIDPGDPAGTITRRLAELAQEYHAAGARPHASGVSVPGIVDERAGIGVFSSNLGWRDAPLRSLAEEALALPVAFGHDVRAAATAEHRMGAARGFDDVVMLAIGTGIAGTIIIDGRPYAGGGYAGEFGHALADPGGERCRCGAIGCVETIASAASIAHRYGEWNGTVVSGAREVRDAMRAGDPIARAVWADAVEALAELLARTCALLAPEAVVIGGGLSEAGEDLFAPLGARLDALLSFHRRPALLRAELGDDAGLLGTALAARALLEAGDS